LFKDIGGFRSKVVRKLGRRIILDEAAFLLFLSDSRENVVKKVRSEAERGDNK